MNMQVHCGTLLSSDEELNNEESKATQCKSDKLPPLGPVEVYDRECKKLGLYPIGSIRKQLHPHSEAVIAKSLSLGPAQMKSLSTSILMLKELVRLDLPDNSIGAGILALRDFLMQTRTLSTVILPNNKLGQTGAEVFHEVMTSGENTSIRYLDLSGNNFTDTDGSLFSDMLCKNNTLKVLLLSNNKFSVSAGRSLASALELNDSLETLDLSWNHIRLEGATAIGKSLMINKGLVRLVLSMNGFGNDGAQAIADAMKANTTLLKLDISFNRIGLQGAIYLFEGLRNNTTLQYLLVGNNPMTSEGALLMLKAIQSNPHHKLTHLDVDNVAVTLEFLSLYKAMIEDGPRFSVYHGGYVRGSTTIPISVESQSTTDFRPDPFHLLMEYLKKKSYRLLDLFSRLDVKKQWWITKQQFIDGIKKVGIQLDEKQLSSLVKDLDTNRDDNIGFSELMDRYKIYIQEMRITKQRKQKRKDQESENQSSPGAIKLTAAPAQVTTASAIIRDAKITYNEKEERYLRPPNL